MGPNRQKREKPKAKPKPGGRRPAHGGHSGGGVPKKPTGGMASGHRDMLLDVLRHVASGGATAVRTEHFDQPRQTITFTRNSALSPTELLCAALAKQGFPPRMVEAYVDSPDVPRPDDAYDTVRGLVSRHPTFFDAAALDLFAMLVIQQQKEMRVEPAAPDAEPTDPDEAASVRAAEWEMVKAMYGEHIVAGGFGEDDDMVGGEASGSEEDGSADDGESADDEPAETAEDNADEDTGGDDRHADTTFEFATADGQATRIVLRLFGDYPRSAPTVRLDGALGPQARASGLAAAAALISQSPMVPCVPALLGCLHEAVVTGVSSEKEEADARAAKEAARLAAAAATAAVVDSSAARTQFMDSLIQDDKSRRAEARAADNAASRSRKAAGGAGRDVRGAGRQVLPPTQPPAAAPAPTEVVVTAEAPRPPPVVQEGTAGAVTAAKKLTAKQREEQRKRESEAAATEAKAKAAAMSAPPGAPVTSRAQPAAAVQPTAAPARPTGKKDTLVVSAASLPAAVELKTVDAADTAAKVRSRHSRRCVLRRDEAVDERMKQQWDHVSAHGSLSARRRELPAFNLRGPLREALRDSRVVVVGGDTGSGKTTQIPQYALEFAVEQGKGSLCNIVCTQPRRLAATAVALRVADEREEEIGGTVGYSIRLENRVSPRTKLLYCTTGIMLRRLQGDPSIGDVSHVIVDEIHERGIDTDFLLILLRDLLRRRADLRVILMSATMNAALFSQYFDGAPVLSIPGRTHPVEIYHLERVIPTIRYALEEDSKYCKRNPRFSQAQQRRMNNRHMSDMQVAAEEAMEETAAEGSLAGVAKAAAGKTGAPVDSRTAATLARMDDERINYELVERLVWWIDTERRSCDGAILIFLPGMAEIQQCHDELKGNPELARRCLIFNLHSSLGSSDQKAVFDRPPKGKRKVVLGTNIMETSITIDDAVYVIDCGRFKENRYDPRCSLSQLVTCWVSRAAAGQRSGRAGRVRPGMCFRLFTTGAFEALEAHQQCEMHRVPLESLILQIHMLNLGDEMDFLRKALDPPAEKAVQASVGVLTDLGALTAKDKSITSLGFHLANLPIDVRIGKMIVIGAVLRCLDPVLTIAACLAVKSPFQGGPDSRAQVEAIKRAFSRSQNSDQLANWHAYADWLKARLPKSQGGAGSERQARDFCRDAFLNQGTLFQIQQTKVTYERYLCEAGFVVPPGFVPGQTPPGGSRAKRFLLQPHVTLEGAVYEAGGEGYNANSANVKCIVAALVAGLYPNIARKTVLKATPTLPPKVKLFTKDGADVVIHPSSVNGGQKQFSLPTGSAAAAGGLGASHPFFIYVEKMKTSMTFLRETTMVSPFALILFGGAGQYLPQFGELVVDDWVGFRIEEEDAVLLMRLREQLESALRAKINDPTMEWESTAGHVVKAMERLLVDEGLRSLPIVERRDRRAVGGNRVGTGSGGGPQHSDRRVVPVARAPAARAEFSKSSIRMKAKTCFNCGERGHLARDCTNKVRGIGPTEACFICGARAHYPPHCPVINKGAAAPTLS